MLTEGVIGSRVRVGAWIVAEERWTAYYGSREVDNPLQEKTTIRVPLLTADVRLTETFGVQAALTLPDITRTALVPRLTGPVNYRENFSGVGDISALGWYRLRPQRRWFPVVNFGVSLPTGKTERPRFRPELEGGNLVPMSRLQRGSGTVDPLFGLSIERRLRRLTMFGSVAARTPFYENEFGLRTGASWEMNAGIARELGNHRIVGFSRIGWLHRRQDSFDGIPVAVGGGNWLYATPGAAVMLGKGLNAQVEIKLPVFRSLANRQLDSNAILQLGISRTF